MLFIMINCNKPILNHEKFTYGEIDLSAVITKTLTFNRDRHKYDRRVISLVIFHHIYKLKRHALVLTN